jgi:hypothetical protein
LVWRVAGVVAIPFLIYCDFGNLRLNATTRAKRHAGLRPFIVRHAFQFARRCEAGENLSRLAPHFCAAYGVTRLELVPSPVTQSPRSLQDEQFLAAGTAQTAGLLAGPRGGTLSQADVLLKIADDAEVKRLETNCAFVLMQYYGYLRRDPNAEGCLHWAGKLESFNGNFISAEMVKAFISSDRYRKRLAQRCPLGKPKIRARGCDLPALFFAPILYQFS